ncbi:hypothetical protein BDK51DRAFT_38669 [Blyttiomyces helicus]|uniref:Uncharacterized protein n=1 Tax=Blyttiomyces helicus TaxID=388810 RepID=A0A4P9W5C5_9FUNG|nr:hypothetical protein BDK51DRAFT_38669 [Blyttiomyces helicus]|eukprot:RKO87454.1 hypothetical protein BDK51DRAFT_38669 [Blyttiomyces helicus]
MTEPFDNPFEDEMENVWASEPSRSATATLPSPPFVPPSDVLTFPQAPTLDPVPIPFPAAAPPPRELRWVTMESGSLLPESVQFVGNDVEGQLLYVARGAYKDGVHPGKFGEHLGGAFIPWGGKEIKLTKFELLGSLKGTSWQIAERDSFPPKAIVCGHEANGQPLYVARGMVRQNVMFGLGGARSTLCLGKAGGNVHGAAFSFADREVTMDRDFEVLVWE